MAMSKPYTFYDHISCGEPNMQAEYIISNVKMLINEIESLAYDNKKVIDHNYNNYKSICNNMHDAIFKIDK